MTYLEQYDSVPNDRPQDKVALITRWIAAEWRPFYEELRENRPILATPGPTLVTRFHDVQEVLSRADAFSVRLYQRSMDPVVDGPFMLARDLTEVNWREKGIMRAMLQLEDLPRVREISRRCADEAFAAAAAEGRIEVVSKLGRYTPVTVCGEYFGFPGPARKTMCRWSVSFQSDMFKNLRNDPQIHAASVESGQEMMAYLRELLEEKRKRADQTSADTIFDRLVKANLSESIRFDDHRLLSNVAGLLIGSVETTSQAIVQAVQQILMRPDIFSAALEAAQNDDDELFDRYVMEALRFNPINPLISRFCESDYVIAAGSSRAHRVPKGTMVFACTPSAMFDAEELPQPDEFRVDRPAYHYMHFGYSHHTCLGQHVAKTMICEVVKRILLKPNIRLIEGDEGKIDFQGTPFPERFVVEFDKTC